MADVTPAEVAVALGRPTPVEPFLGQWTYWISAAYMLIRARARAAGVDYGSLDEATVKYVVTEAVAAQVRRPDDSTSVEVKVDDSSTTKRYSSSRGRVSIWADLWDMLGLPDDEAQEGGAFSISPSYTPDVCGERGLSYPWRGW